MCSARIFDEIASASVCVGAATAGGWFVRGRVGSVELHAAAATTTARAGTTAARRIDTPGYQLARKPGKPNAGRYRHARSPPPIYIVVARRTRPMPDLTIRLKRHPDHTASLSCTRRDGSVTWQRQRGSLGAVFPPHDLTHYAVEQTLGFQHGFYGLI